MDERERITRLEVLNEETSKDVKRILYILEGNGTPGLIGKYNQVIGAIGFLKWVAGVGGVGGAVSVLISFLK